MRIFKIFRDHVWSNSKAVLRNFHIFLFKGNILWNFFVIIPEMCMDSFFYSNGQRSVSQDEKLVASRKKAVPTMSMWRRNCFSQNRYISVIRWSSHWQTLWNTEVFTVCTVPAGIYLLKANSRNTRTRCKICSKLTIKTPGHQFWCLYC